MLTWTIALREKENLPAVISGTAKMDMELGITLSVKSRAGAGPLLSHLTLLLRTPIAVPHKPTCWQSQASCGSGKMSLLKYTFLYSVLHGIAFYII